MDFVGNLLLFAAGKKFTNRSRIDKVIAIVRLAQFFWLTVYKWTVLGGHFCRLAKSQNGD